MQFRAPSQPLPAVHHDGSARYLSELHPRPGAEVTSKHWGRGPGSGRAWLRYAPDGEEMRPARAPSARAAGSAGGRPRSRLASRWSTTGSSWRPRPRPLGPRPALRPPAAGRRPASRLAGEGGHLPGFPDGRQRRPACTRTGRAGGQIPGRGPTLGRLPPPPSSPSRWSSTAATCRASSSGSFERLGADVRFYLNPIFTSPSNHRYDVADDDLMLVGGQCGPGPAARRR